MNKISFIIEFDEVSKTQEEQLTEFIEKTGIKFHVLENDNDLKEYEKYKEVIDKTIEKINDYKIYCEKNKGLTEYTDIEIEAIEPVISKLEDILKEVSE